MPNLRGKHLDSPHKVALASLAIADTGIAHMLKEVGYPDTRTLPHHWHTLVKLIIEQQLSIQVADTVWQRVAPLLTHNVNKMEFDDAQLLAAGLSRSKLEYLKCLHAALMDKRLNLTRLQQKNNSDAIKEITAVKGLGLWTAHCYLLFALNRKDVFPIGDLALLRAWQFALQRPELSQKDLALMAENWHPNKSAVALLSWKYYSHKKKSRLESD